MTTDQAKFILSAFRPNGSDADNPAFGDALRMAGDDPLVGRWFEQSRAHDAAVAAKLRTLAPPPGLREAILAGGRVSRPGRSRDRRWGWAAGLAAAAAVAALALVSLRTSEGPGSTSAAFATFAVDDMVHGSHGSKGEAAGALIASLQAEGSSMPSAGNIDFERLRETGCRTLTFAGHDVLEVCFARSGAEFHLYVTRRDGPMAKSIATAPSFIQQAAGAAVVWADGRYDYAVASQAGAEALRRLLRR